MVVKMNYILEYCRLFCYDHWMKYDCKSKSKWSKFWVRMHSLFWNILYKRITHEEWVKIYEKINDNKRKHK